MGRTQIRRFIVSADVLPKVFLKVVEANRLLETGTALTVNDAASMVGISRSAFYKYKDSITPFLDMRSKRIVIFNMQLRDNKGALSAVLSLFAASDANILTIGQNAPQNGTAYLSLTAEISEVTGSTEELLKALNEMDNVVRADILAG